MNIQQTFNPLALELYLSIKAYFICEPKKRKKKRNKIEKKIENVCIK